VANAIFVVFKKATKTSDNSGRTTVSTIFLSELAARVLPLLGAGGGQQELAGGGPWQQALFGSPPGRLETPLLGLT
jgi:hypothetical protein